MSSSKKRWATLTFTAVKSISFVGAVLWALSSLSGINKETKAMKDAYIGFKLSNQKVMLSLESNNTSLHLQNDTMKSNQTALLKSLNAQQDQVDGLIKFLMTTQPDHKATLQSFTGKVLTD